jgi:quercetin dioxygenase-like cupin family protein
MAWSESKAWMKGTTNDKLYQALLDDATAAPARNAKRKKIVHPEDMPWEMSRQGILKHLLNEQMNTRMETVDAYMQIIPPGSRSGKHRQLAESCVYVLEGKGYDLHQDCDVEITDTYHWKPQDEVKRFEWEAGDVIYIPPNTICQHFNAEPDRPVRLIVAVNRIYKQCGLNDLEQIEDAPEYDPKVVLTPEIVARYLAKQGAHDEDEGPQTGPEKYTNPVTTA